MNRRYEVSAEWMKACGFGNEARVFDVLRVSSPRNGLTAITLDRDGHNWVVIAEWRGRFVQN